MAQAVDALFVVLGGKFSALEHREQPLDGADGDAGSGVELVALQVLDDVFLAELVVVIGRVVGVELLLGLPAQVAPVDQKKHPFGAGKLDQAVDEADGGIGLAAAGGHLNQGAGLIGCERRFQVADRRNLRRPQAVFEQLRHGLQPGQEGRCPEVGTRRHLGAGMDSATGQIGAGSRQVLQQGGQRLGAMKGEHRTGARMRVQPLREMGLDASGFVAEGKGAQPGWQRFGQALGVSGRLHFHAGEGAPRLLGLDHTRRPAVDIEQVVGKPISRVEREFAQRHAAGRMDVGIGHVADMPAGLLQQRINGLSGFGLRCHAAPW